MNQENQNCSNCSYINYGKTFDHCENCGSQRQMPQSNIQPPQYNSTPNEVTEQVYAQQSANYNQQQTKTVDMSAQNEPVQPQPQQAFQPQQQPQYQPQYQAQPQQQAHGNIGNDCGSAAQYFRERNGSIDYSHSKYRDQGQAVAFIIHLLVIIVLLIVFHNRLYFSKSDNTSSTDSHVNRNDTSTTILIVATMSVVSLVFSIFWIQFIKRFPSTIIWVSFILVVLLQIALAIIAIIFSSTIFAIIIFVQLALFLLYAYFARKRIPFAAVMLEMSAQYIQDHSGPVYISFIIAALSIGQIIIQNLTVLVLSDVINSNGFGLFILLISFYWTYEVLSNVVHVTAAGVAATQYFVPQTRNPTRGAFKRATTTSFGSICFGSLLIAIVNAIRTMLHIAREEAGNNQFILCFIDCIFSFLETVLRYLNLFAFAQVAIYGKDYWTAAKHTQQLFKSKGFEAIVNDDLTGWVLLLGAFISAVMAAILGSLQGHSSDNVSDWVSIGVICFFVGFFLMTIIMSVIRSYITTFFVCFAEDPAVLTQTHPPVYEKMVKAIRKMHGHSYDNHFGGQQAAVQQQQYPAQQQHY